MIVIVALVKGYELHKKPFGMNFHLNSKKIDLQILEENQGDQLV
jgi:hypothetical protein